MNDSMLRSCAFALLVLLACDSGDGGEGSDGDVLGTGSGSATPSTPAATGGNSAPGPNSGTGGIPEPGGGGTPTSGEPDPGTAGTPNPGSGGDSGFGPTPAEGGSPDPGTGGSEPGGAGSGMGGAGGQSAGVQGTGGSAEGGSGGTVVEAGSFSVDVQLASDVDPNAPGTVGIVTWSTDVDPVASAAIEFGLDEGYGLTAPVDLEEADYRTLLLGMKPAQTYHFRVVVESGSGSVASEDYTVETGPPTDLIELSAFEVMDDAARERGFIVTSYWNGSGGTVPFIIDADGEIVWWYESNSNGIARARMSADGRNMWLVMASNQGAPLERVTLDTLDGQVYEGVSASHDLTPVTGELMAFLEYGESDCDSIFEIDPSGTTVEIFESEGEVSSQGCHSNALRYSAAEDVYTFSDVSQDVLVINRDGQVEWRLSEIAGGNSVWGGTQHGHHLLADSMLVFANRFGGEMSSAALEFTLDGEEILRYETGNFSANLGDVQRLPGGNTLVTFSNDSIIHEIDDQGNLLLEIDGGGDAFGYALWRETLYGAPPDIGD